MSKAPAKPKGLVAYQAVVTAVQDLSDTFKRITLSCPEFEDFGGDEQGRTLDLRIKVMIPNEGKELPDLEQLIQGSEGMSWYQQWLQLDENERGFMRTYSVRNLRRQQQELDIDFVMHGGEGVPSGPAGNWAGQASVGDPLVLIGPTLSAGPSMGIEFNPGDARQVLLVGDETAVPAISAIVEEFKNDYSFKVFLEVPEVNDFVPIDVNPRSTGVLWLNRGSAPQGLPHGQRLEEELRARFSETLVPGAGAPPSELEDVDVDQTILWETPEVAGTEPTQGMYAWIAGEAGFVKELRRFFVNECGMDRRQVAFMGYWRKGKAER